MGESSSPLGSASTTLARGAGIGRYVLLDPVGEGGMGVVYKAYDPELDRPVALKFLRAKTPGESQGTEASRSRLLREAKALARLSHPNVLAVFEVGTAGEDVFLATEFVEGETLAAWLLAERRSRREILRVFLAAAEGLAAAHRAGLVHRDFKPSNVMLGRDGRVRVLDFGVALVAGRAARPRPAGPPEEEKGARPTKPLGESTSTTRTLGGEGIGTLHYMAPEQHLGEEISARADQFAFALSLYEAVYREPAFDGHGLDYVNNLVLGKIRPAPSGADVPRWLRAVLLRALSAAPEARYASIEALAAALADDPQTRRRRWLVGGLAAAGVALVATAAATAQRARMNVCGGAEQKLAGVWDDAQRAAVARAFGQSPAPYAKEAGRTVVRTLDAFAGAWARDRREACEATRVRGEQSDELLDLRMQCLDERLEELRARAGQFATADAPVVEHAAESLQGLPSLATCDDAVALRAPVRLPEGPGAREALETIRAHVAKARALADALRLDDAQSEAETAVQGARALGYSPAESEALRAQAVVAERAARYDASVAAYRAAIASGAAGHDEDLVARAWPELISVVGERLGRFDEARGLLWIARAEDERLPKPEEQSAQLDLVEAKLDWRKGRYADAEPLARRATTTFEAIHGPDSIELAKALGSLGLILDGEGKRAEAEACRARDLAIMEGIFGAEHPAILAALSHVADALGTRGDHRGAIALYERALRISESSLGAAHPTTARIQNNLADELLAVGDVDGAIPHEQSAIAIWEKALGAGNFDLAAGLFNLGSAYLKKGDAASAVAPLRRSVAISIGAYGPTHFAHVGELLALAKALRALGQTSDAAHEEARALAIDAKLGAEVASYDLPVRLDLGEALLRAGLAERAVQALGAGLPGAGDPPGDAAELAPLRFELARAIVAAGGDRAKARALGEQALDGMRSDAGAPGDDPDARALERWLAAL